MSEKLGFDEVVDTLADAIEIADAFEKQVKDLDGSLIEKAIPIMLSLVTEYPKMSEIYNDRLVFAAEFRDLDAIEAEQVIKKVSERVGQEFGFVADKALRALNLSSFIYSTVQDLIGRFEYVKEEAKLLFSGRTAA